MRNLTVSDIFCLTSQTEGHNSTASQEQLFSVKGNASSRLLRRRDYQNSGVFPPGCMGNSKLVDLGALNHIAKKRERLSYDEQERAMNILARIRRGRESLRVQSDHLGNNSESNSNASLCRSSEGKKYRLTVRRSQPDMSDFEYLLELIKTNDEAALEGRGDDGGILSSLELRFMSGIMTKEDAMGFFTSRLRGRSSPSRMCRNPITGNGVEDNSRHERKRGFESVVRFIEDTKTGMMVKVEGDEEII